MIRLEIWTYYEDTKTLEEVTDTTNLCHVVEAIKKYEPKFGPDDGRFSVEIKIILANDHALKTDPYWVGKQKTLSKDKG